jgi:ankyrin repeat protein
MKQFIILIFSTCLSFYSYAQLSLDERLLDAVKNNHTDSVKFLVEHGADVNYADTNKATVVMWAALNGDLEIVKSLVKKGADVRQKGIIDDNYIYGNITGIAAGKKNLPLLKYLIEECGIPYNDKELVRSGSAEEGWDAFIYSLNVKDTSIIRYLLPNYSKLSSLELNSISTACNMDLDDLILRNLNKIQNDSIGLLMLVKSIYSNKAEFVRQIILKYPVINELNSDSLSPLCIAIINNTSEIIQNLLNSGADINQIGEKKKTPLYFAIDVNNLQLAKQLIKSGANLNHQDCYGRSPLFYATLQNRSEIVKFLLESGADANLASFDHDTPLNVAEEGGFLKTRDYLMDHHAERNSVNQVFKPELILPPNKSSLSNLIVSYDNKYILGVSGSSIYLIDNITGKILRKVTYPSFFTSYGFSKDNNSIIFSNGGILTFYDIRREESVKEFPYRPSQGISLFPQSNRYLIKLQNGDGIYSKLAGRIDSEGEIVRYASENAKLIDLDNNKIVSKLPGYLQGYSSNGNTILSDSYDSLRLWNIERKINRAIKAEPQSHFGTGVVSNNGSYCLINRFFNDPSIKYNSYDSYLKREIILMDTNNDIIWSLSYNNNQYVNLPTFSDNNEYFGLIYNRKLQVYKLNNYQTPSLILEIEGVRFYYFDSQIGIYLIRDDGTLERINLKTGKFVNIRESIIQEPLRCFADKASILRIACENNNVIYDFNLEKSSIIKTSGWNLPEHFNSINFSKDGTHALLHNFTADYNDSIFLFNISGSTHSATPFKGHNSKYLNFYGISPDNMKIFISSGSELNIYDLTNKELKRVSIFERTEIRDIAFSNDNKFVAISSTGSYYDSIENITYTFSDGLFKVFIADTFDTIFTAKTSKPIVNLAFSPDDTFLAVALKDGSIMIYDYIHSRLVKKIKLTQYEAYTYLPDGWTRNNSIAFHDSHQDRYSYISGGNHVYIFDWSNLEFIRDFAYDEHNITISENDKWIFSPSIGGAIKIWDIEKEKQIGSIYIIDSLNYIVLAPNGLFDATPDAMKFMYYIAGMETIDLNQLKGRYYQPGLLPILLGYSDEKLREVPPFDYVRLFPSKKLRIENDQLKVELKNRGGGIGKVSVYIDNIMIREDARSDQDSSLSQLNLSINLKDYARYFRYDSINIIKVVSWNAEGYLCSRPDTVHFIPHWNLTKGTGNTNLVSSSPAISPQLFGLIIGTSDYAGNNIDLKYASDDAEAFSTALETGASRLFGNNNVHIMTLATGFEKQEPTMVNILKCFSTLTDAKPEDVIVVYFSGHGVNFGGQDGSFYYLTMEANESDANYLKDPYTRKTKTLSCQDIATCLNQIPSRKKVLIFDACSSGKAADMMYASLIKEIPSSQKRALEFTQDATGCYIIASSATNTASYENPRYGHGLLTYALLKGMRGGKLERIEENEFIEVENLFQYSKQEVPQLAKEISGIQEPIVKLPETPGKLFIGQITNEDKLKIEIKETNAVFVPCQFANDDLLGNDLDLGERINIKLDQLSSKGGPVGIQFTREGNLPEAYIIKGKYKIRNQKLDITYGLKQGNKTIMGPIQNTYPISDLNRIVDDIINKIIESVGER